MKSALILLWLLASSLTCVADTNFLAPSQVLKADGVLTITDGSSYYLFRTNGTFRSYPVGESGRCFDGTWTSDGDWIPGIPGPSTFTVEAKVTWINGITAADEYRKIVFKVYPGQKLRLQKPPRQPSHPTKCSSVTSSSRNWLRFLNRPAQAQLPSG